jgi:MraZ protein
LAFRGQFDHSLDAKNRLNVPAKFRAAFADGVVLQKALDPCIAIWTPRQFEEFTESFLRGLGPLSRERRRLSIYFSGNSWDVELDSAGRVTFNQPLLDHAGIEREVVVVGNVDHLEVWDRRRWREHQRELDNQIVEIAESLDHPS